MIQIITQTMIGDYLWKYTRRPMANVISEKRHRRYFWIHPYSKTINWSLSNPGGDGSREQRAKSAVIINVYQITEENPPSNSDLPNISLLVQTSNRSLKLTAPSRQKHDLWYQSLAYLLSRPTAQGTDVPSDNQTWSEVQASRGVNADALLTVRNEKSVRKKRSFTRLGNIFGRSSSNKDNNDGSTSPSGSPRSTTTATIASHGHGLGIGAPITINPGYPSHANPPPVGGYGTVNGGPIMSQAGIGAHHNMSPRSKYEMDEYHGEYDDDMDDDDYDDGDLPENVRQCCDGKHDIGALNHHHHH